ARGRREAIGGSKHSRGLRCSSPCAASPSPQPSPLITGVREQNKGARRNLRSTRIRQTNHDTLGKLRAAVYNLSLIRFTRRGSRKQCPPSFPRSTNNRHAPSPTSWRPA